MDISITEKQATIAGKYACFEFNLTDGTYRGIDPRSGLVMFQDAWFRLDPGAQTWRTPAHDFRAEAPGDARVAGLDRPHTLRVWYTPREGYDPERFLDISISDYQPFSVIGWGVRNRFDREIRVQRAEVLQGGRLFEGQAPRDEKVLRMGAGAEPNFVESTREIEAMNGAMLTWRDETAGGPERRTLVCGGLAYAEFARQVQFGGKEPRATLTVWDPQGKRIAPGETWISNDTFYLDFSTPDPFDSLERYGNALAHANNASPNVYDFPTLCGWAVSSGHLGEGRPINNSPGLVEQVGLARDAGLLEYFPVAVRLEPDFYCYGNHGDTQQGWWDDAHWEQYGSLKEPYETFAKFCSGVEERGGIVFTYFQCSLPSNDFAVAHPDWMLNNDISLLHIDHAHHRPLVRYDYTDPGFQRHVLAVWRRLREDGVRGIKFDYPETAWARDGGFEDGSFTTVAAYRKLFELCREGLGPDAFLHERNIGGDVHEAVPRLDVSAGVVDLQRTWGDASHFEPEMASRIGLRWYKQGKVFRYYPDCKSFCQPGDPETPLSAKDRRTFLTLVGLLSGRIELATSFGRMTPEMVHDLTRLYPMLPNSLAFRPVDLLITQGHPAVYALQVAPDWTQVLLVNNDTEKAQAVSAPLAGDPAEEGGLGLEAAAEYEVFEFWSQKPGQPLKGSEAISVELEPGETVVYSIRRALNRPRVMGTNRHVMCGMFELRNEAWDAESKTLSLEARVMAVEPLEVTLATPGGWDGYVARSAKADGAQADVCQYGRIVQLALRRDPGAPAHEWTPVRILFEADRRAQSGPNGSS